MSNPVLAALLAELRAQGVRDWRVVTKRGGHPMLHFEWQGRVIRHPFSNSPSRDAAARESLKDMRRRMGIGALAGVKAMRHG